MKRAATPGNQVEFLEHSDSSKNMHGIVGRTGQVLAPSGYGSPVKLESVLEQVGGVETDMPAYHGGWSTQKFSQMLEEYCREKYLKQSSPQAWPLGPFLLPAPHSLSYFPSMVQSAYRGVAPGPLINPQPSLAHYRLH